MGQSLPISLHYLAQVARAGRGFVFPPRGIDILEQDSFACWMHREVRKCQVGGAGHSWLLRVEYIIVNSMQMSSPIIWLFIFLFPFQFTTLLRRFFVWRL